MTDDIRYQSGTAAVYGPNGCKSQPVFFAASRVETYSASDMPGGLRVFASLTEDAAQDLYAALTKYYLGEDE